MNCAGRPNPGRPAFIQMKTASIAVASLLGLMLPAGAEWIITPAPDGMSIAFTLVVPELRFDATTEGAVPRVPGQAAPLRPGAPDVPVLAQAVPCAGRGTPSVRILETSPEDVTNTVVAPAPRWVADAESRTPMPVPVRVREEAVYSANAFWPAELADVQVGFMATQALARIECRPVQYNPVTGTVRVHRRIRGVVEFLEAGSTEKADGQVP